MIGSLAFAVGLNSKLIDQLDRYRKKRSVSIYDMAGAITDSEATAMQSIAEALVEPVRAWLTQNHATLLKPRK